MKTRAAIAWEVGTEYTVEEIDLDPPKAGEVLIELAASGMCRSDEHRLTGHLGRGPKALPVVGGHEGAGVVVEVGPDVHDLQPGDHVVGSFVPSCGRCPSCASGHSNLCDLGQYLGPGRQITDHTARHHARGVDLSIMCLLGTFAEHTVVNQASCIKIDPAFPLEKACLFGCGVVTGWGSAVYAADVRPGEDVIVVGIGGVGSNAVQGARLAGARRIFAIDPVPFKRERALEFGATHTAPTMAEAFEMVQDVTWGRMANKVIMTMGVGVGSAVAEALALTAKRGRVVITNIHSNSETEVSLRAEDLTQMEKQVVGTLFGSGNPRYDIVRLMDLHNDGLVKIDELITRTYKLDDVALGYDDMRNGRIVRGVITFP